MPQQKLLEKSEEVTFDEEDETLDDELASNGKSQSVLKEISKIIVAGTDWTTATILDQMVRENIQLNPRFQRRDAWDIIRKSRFIESIFLGFPIPEIVLASMKKPGKNLYFLTASNACLQSCNFMEEAKLLTIVSL